MELVFSKEELLKAMQMLQGVAAGRNTLPILSNVLIRASEGQIEIAATDLEVGIRMNVPGEVVEEGGITVSARILSEIVRELPPEAIKLTTTANDRVEITCGEGVYKIIGLPDDEFPDLPSIESSFFTMDAPLLCSTIHRTEFAASTDEEARYFLNGIYFHMTPEWTKVVATDGRRLAVVSSGALTPPPEEPTGVILPLKAVKEIAKTFAESAEVKICLLDNQVIFADDDTTLTSRLVEGEYPQYEQIIPEDNENRTVVETEKFRDAVTRVALLANQKTYAIRLDIQEDNIRVSSRTPELGEADETVGVKEGSGTIEIGLNARFLVDVLRHIETDEVVIESKDGNNAAVLKPIEDDNYLCLVMPMRLES